MEFIDPPKTIWDRFLLRCGGSYKMNRVPCGQEWIKDPSLYKYTWFDMRLDNFYSPRKPLKRSKFNRRLFRKVPKFILGEWKIKDKLIGERSRYEEKFITPNKCRTRKKNRRGTKREIQTKLFWYEE